MTDILNVIPQAGISQRKTKPGGYNPYSEGGVEVIPRRQDIRNGVMTPLVSTSAEMRASAFANPLRVLALLGDIDPLVSKAQRNVLTLTCAPGDVTFVAKKQTAPGAGDDDTDDAGTKKIDELWLSLPQEVGGLKGLRKALTLMSLYAGLLCIEIVPGPLGTGVEQLWPVDPLTIIFKRKVPGGPAVPYQRQGGTDVELDPQYFFWVAIDASVDNPYGRPVYAAALPEVLRNMALNQDLSDSVHNSAWKRLIYKYSLERLYEIAKNVLGLLEEDVDENGITIYPIAAWVNKQTDQIKVYLGTLKPDDNPIVDSSDNGGIDTIEGANLAGIEPVIDNQRLRVIQSLDETPTMMGVDGAGFNFGSVVWAVRAQGLEDLRDDVIGLLTRVADLHLQLLGLPLSCEVEVKPIRTTDNLVDAQARQYEIANEERLVNRGYVSDEAAAMKLTGSGVANPEQAAKALANSLVAKVTGIADINAAKPGLPAGSTAEERGATSAAK